MLTADRHAPARNPADGLAVANLLNDLDALAGLLARSAAGRLPLDAFLVACGINQILEDRLHDAPYPFDAAASLLRTSRSRSARVAGRIAGVAAVGLRSLNGHGAPARRTLALQRQTALIVDRLAAAVVADAGGLEPGLAGRCRNVAAAIPSLPADVRSTVLRLPACFYNFDQRPEDILALAGRVTVRRPPDGRPLLCVGVRTSGSYLAPLLAASLRAEGHAGATFMTVRPGRTLLAHERATVRSLARRGGSVLLIDDPPVTGGSLAAAAASLRRLGVAPEAIVVTLALDGETTVVPQAVAAYASVVLPADAWAARRALEPSAVAPAVTDLLDGELTVESLEVVAPAGRPGRHGHGRAVFAVGGRDRAGAARRLHLVAESVGPGYLGRHHLAVAEAIGTFAPRVLGLRDGVLYREWLPDERRMAARSARFPSAVASYVAARRRALPVDRDLSPALAGQGPAWEIIGAILGQGFARGAPVARVLLVNRAARRLLRVASPSVVDGSMGPEQWFTGEGGSPVKVGLTTRTYWNLGLACFDAAFDLAGAAAAASDGELAADLHAAWHRATGEHIEPERWLLYELAHHWARRHEAGREDGSEADARHAGARAAARYCAERFLADLGDGAAGPLCALDIDGVLETEQLGFPAPTRSSGLAVRALVAHGYRPVPVTGRGLQEVRDRCRAYGFVAGVAEYGSAICLDGGERALILADDRSRTALVRLASVLRDRDGVRLDPAFAVAVRAYRLNRDGARRPLAATEIDECLEACRDPHAVRVVAGQSQTDFVPAGADKASAVEVLRTALGRDGTAAGGRRPRLALAVGDTASDASMLAAAETAYVPAHASPAAASTGAIRTSRPYQAGLAQAVGGLLGHRPGTCPSCRPPAETADSALLLDLLSIAETGTRGLAAGALRLAWRLR